MDNDAKIKKDAEKLAEAGITLEMVKEMQKKMTDLEVKVEEGASKNAGLEELFRTADPSGEPKLREKKNFEPKFHTVRLRKYPVAGDFDNQDFIVGWTERGAYQQIDTSGISRQVVDYIDIFFLNGGKTEDGKRKAERVKLLDIMNNGNQIVCKILEEKKETKRVETGEEIEVSTFDPIHGLIATGDKVDGYCTYSEISYKVAIPGTEGVWIDAKFCNQ